MQMWILLCMSETWSGLLELVIRVRNVRKSNQ